MAVLNREYLIRAAWPLVISWASIGSLATVSQLIYNPSATEGIIYPEGRSNSLRFTYIFQVLLSQYGKQESRHSIIHIRGHGHGDSAYRGKLMNNSSSEDLRVVENSHARLHSRNTLNLCWPGSGE